MPPGSPIHRISSQLPAPEPPEVPVTVLEPRLWRMPGPVTRLLLLALVAGGLALPTTDRSDGGPTLSLRSVADGGGLAANRASAASAEELVAVPPEPGASAFATVEGIELALPSPHTRAVAFHEASYANALAMVPVGTIVANDNPTKFTAGAPSDGPDGLVLSSRGRPHPATSAVDLVLDDGEAVRAVASGTVSLVEPYQLYGRHPDTRIEIVPDARPDLRIVLIHVEDVRVAPGDRVVAGETTVAGSANLFPFRSHVDRYVPGEPRPHVHVEVKVPDEPAA